LQKWYQRYGHELYRTLCRAVKDSDLAQEISQETFLKMAVKLSHSDGGEEIQNPRAFLYKIAYNEIYSRHKRQKLQQHLGDVFAETDYEIQNNITPEEIALNKQELAAVENAIEALPQKQKAAFMLSRVDHMTHAEIANDLGIQKSSVKQHIVRALSLLRRARDKKNG